MASGYWGRADLTAERFLPNPFGEGVHARRYATGDLARWTHDLELEYLGRIDRQVKVRGVRVELGDAEAAVARIPGIREAAVIGVPSSHDTTRLVAHVVTDEGVDLGEARRMLAARVPDYLVPSELRRIDALPLLPSGKIDRRALATTEIHRPAIDTGEIDDELAAMIDIWRDVVATDEIGPDDDFFDVGGHSLAGMRVLARLHRDHGVNLELSVLYSDSTPRALLDRVRTIAAGDATDDAGSGVRHLVRITTADDPRRTLYCVHGAGGNVLNFRDLARALSPGWGVVGVQARGVDGITPPHESLDELCDAYISELLADHPDGPQFLAGFSGGGIIAYEIAVRLAARGRPLTALILFDTFHRSIQARRRTPGEHLAALFRQGPAYLLERRRVRRQRHLYANAQDVVEANTAHDEPVPHELRDAHVVASIRSMLDDYETPDYDGAVWLYAATDVRDVLRHAGPDRGWSRSASDLFTESVPGDHDDLILEPHASQLAARLGERLDRAFADTDTNQVGA